MKDDEIATRKADLPKKLQKIDKISKMLQFTAVFRFSG